MSEGDPEEPVWDGDHDHDVPEPKEAPKAPIPGNEPDEGSVPEKDDNETSENDDESMMEEPDDSDQNTQAGSSGSGIGLWSMISGIVAVVLGFLSFSGALFGACGCCFGTFGFIAAVAAIIMGIISLSDASSKGKGKLGIILGIAYFVLMVLSIILMIVVSILFNIATFAF